MNAAALLSTRQPLRRRPHVNVVCALASCLRDDARDKRRCHRGASFEGGGRVASVERAEDLVSRSKHVHAGAWTRTRTQTSASSNLELKGLLQKQSTTAVWLMACTEH
eukprot:2445157-Pleurochrysis_carterae.AAC.1